MFLFLDNVNSVPNTAERETTFSFESHTAFDNITFILSYFFRIGSAQAKPSSVKPSSNVPKPSPTGRNYPNIEEEDEKKEFFDTDEELGRRLTFLQNG